jgi:hypothetical protein
MLCVCVYVCVYGCIVLCYICDHTHSVCASDSVKKRAYKEQVKADWENFLQFRVCLCVYLYSVCYVCAYLYSVCM